MTREAAGDGRHRQPLMRLADARGGRRGSRRVQDDHGGGWDAGAEAFAIVAVMEWAANETEGLLF